MSRTYRCRHLPKIEVKRHYVKRCCKVVSQKPVLVEPDWFNKLYFNAKPHIVTKKEIIYWRELEVDKFLVEKYVDGCHHRRNKTANASHHPWVKWWKRSGIKKWYRTVGNRAYRHRVKQIIQSEQWEEGFPSRKEYIDWWDLY